MMDPELLGKTPFPHSAVESISQLFAVGVHGIGTVTASQLINKSMRDYMEIIPPTTAVSPT